MTGQEPAGEHRENYPISTEVLDENGRRRDKQVIREILGRYLKY